jgi:uncharacterized membrane protein
MMTGRDVPIGAALTFGWETFKKNALFLVGVYVAVSITVSVIESADEYGPVSSGYASFVIGMISFLVYMVLRLGTIRITLKFKDGVMPEFADLFNRWPLAFSYLAASLLYFLMVMVGLALFVLPGIFIAVRFYFYGYFISDGELNPIDALRKSLALTRGFGVELFVLGVALLGLNILGLLCLVLGLVVTMPVSGLAMAFVFRHLQEGAGSVGTK